MTSTTSPTLTTALVQPEPLDGLETVPARAPNHGRQRAATSTARDPGLASIGLPVIPNFANPLQFICSAIQAGSRLGYQESAELCAQYLAPILDAIKFNYLPFGCEPGQHGATLAQDGRLLRGAAAAAAGLQGHHRARHLLARHVVLASATTSRAGSSRRACRVLRCSPSPRTC